MLRDSSILTSSLNKSLKRPLQNLRKHRKLQLSFKDKNRTFSKPTSKKSSKDAINRSQFIAKLMKGVLNPSRGSYLQHRFNSPQPEPDSFIMLPSFDRGKRKISKMGGSMFSAISSNRIAASMSGVQRRDQSRRLTSTSPKPHVKLHTPLMKKHTFLNVIKEI